VSLYRVLLTLRRTQATFLGSALQVRRIARVARAHDNRAEGIVLQTHHHPQLSAIAHEVPGFRKVGYVVDLDGSAKAKGHTLLLSHPPCECPDFAELNEILGNALGSRSLLGAQQAEELADGMLPLGGMAHTRLAIDAVAVASADSLARHVASLHEVVRDALGGTFGDAYRLRDVAHPYVGVVLDADEHLRVIREKVPAIRFGT
jgi:hypothetical protein